MKATVIIHGKCRRRSTPAKVRDEKEIDRILINKTSGYESYSDEKKLLRKRSGLSHNLFCVLKDWVAIKKTRKQMIKFIKGILLL